MLAMMPRRAEDEADAAVIEGFYRMDLEDLPVEELIKAFGDWRSGRHKRPDGSPFAPSIGEVRALVEKHISDRLMAAKRQRQLQEEAAETRAYRERIALQTPEHRMNVASVDALIKNVAGAKDMAKFVDGPLGPCNPHGFTYEELCDPDCIVNAVGRVPYTMRPAVNGMLSEYGYLTPREIRLGRGKDIDDFARETI